MEQVMQKGVSKKRDEDTTLNVLVSNKEVEYFIQCGQHIGKDNVLFFGDANTKNKVFLLLHGGKDGKVLFNGAIMSLKDIYHYLHKENVFDILKILDIKNISKDNLIKSYAKTVLLITSITYLHIVVKRIL